MHKPDFSALIFDLHGGKIKYGDFMNAIISFLLIAAVVYFVFVLPVNALMKKFRPAEAAPPKPAPAPSASPTFLSPQSAAPTAPNP